MQLWLVIRKFIHALQSSSFIFKLQNFCLGMGLFLFGKHLQGDYNLNKPIVTRRMLLLWNCSKTLFYQEGETNSSRYYFSYLMPYYYICLLIQIQSCTANYKPIYFHQVFRFDNSNSDSSQNWKNQYAIEELYLDDRILSLDIDPSGTFFCTGTAGHSGVPPSHLFDLTTYVRNSQEIKIPSFPKLPSLNY